VNYFRIAERSSCKPVIFLFLITSFIFFPWSFPSALNAEESSCVSCHTDATKLIELTKDIEAPPPPACSPSKLNKGEG
jgi:hypothetical protein